MLTLSLYTFSADIFTRSVKKICSETNLEYELTAFFTEYAKVVRFQIDKARGPIRLYSVIQLVLPFKILSFSQPSWLVGDNRY